MCIWASVWHALVHITAPGEPLSGGYSSPQNGRGISELALWADAPELPASAPFVMSASLAKPAPTCPSHSRVQPVQRGRLTGEFSADCAKLKPVRTTGVAGARFLLYLVYNCRLHLRGPEGSV